MNFIRASEAGKWEHVFPIHVYLEEQKHEDPTIVGLGDGRIYKGEFVEIAMRMLDQSGELSDEELEAAHMAFRERLNMNEEEL